MAFGVFAPDATAMHSKLRAQHSAQALKCSGKFTWGQSGRKLTGSSAALTFNRSKHSARARRNTVHSRYVFITEAAVSAGASVQE